MKPTILRGELLMWVMHLVSDGREEAERGLSAADRWAVESVVGTACQDQVALGEYLDRLQREIGDRPAPGTGLDDPVAWTPYSGTGFPRCRTRGCSPSRSPPRRSGS